MYITDRKEQFSNAYVRAVASKAGVSVYERNVDIDSIDIGFCGKGKYSEKGSWSPTIEAQLKCTENFSIIDNGTNFSFPLKIKNYNELRVDNVFTPRILIVMHVPEKIEEWLNISNESIIMKYTGYWVSLKGQPETENTETVTVKIPKDNLFNSDALLDLIKRTGNGEF